MATTPPPSASGTTRRRSRPRPWGRSPLADRLRLRAFLRLPRRRDLAVGAAAGRELPPDRAAARREVSPVRGHGRQGRRLDAKASCLCAGQAVLPVLGARRRSRPAPYLQGVGGPYKGKFDDGWDAMRERVFGARMHWGGYLPIPSSRRARPTMAAWANPGVPAGVPARLMEVFAGFVEHVDAQAGKVIDELERAGPSRQHAGVLHLRRQRLARRPERLDQRAAGPEQHPEHDRAAARRAERARRA